MCPSSYLPVLQLTRGDVVESVHYGAIAVVSADGKLVASYGDARLVTFLRSSSKPFQALPFIENGGKEKYGLSEREVALICASHLGTDEHKAVVSSIQAKTGVQESDLLCGIHAISHQETADAMAERGEKPTPNRHNCSGKHTGMVAFARMRGLPFTLPGHAYIDFEHPIQQEIRKTLAEMCVLPVEQVHLGVDGCSAPNFAIPLYNAAYGLARLCDPHDMPEPRAAACRTIVQAMLANPDMVAGPGAFDTCLIQALGKKALSKGGAEGYQALAVLPGAIGPGSPAMGIAFKISDGDLGSHNRGPGAPRGQVRPPVALEILRQLGVLTASEAEQLASFGPRYTLSNFRHVQVGEAYPCFTLNWD